MNADSVRKTKRTTTVRKHERGVYDRNTVYSIIDSTPLCHVSYIIDDWPYVTPTIQWREDNRIFWHGSSASRFLRKITNKPACLAVTHFDGLVLARSASHHSANYRSVMLFGTTEALIGKEKDRALESFMESMFPGRWSQLRPMTEIESKSTAVLSSVPPIVSWSTQVSLIRPLTHTEFGSTGSLPLNVNSAVVGWRRRWRRSMFSN